MKKERLNMYEIMTKDYKKIKNSNKNFYINVQTGEVEHVKALVSRNMINSLGSDMLDMVNFMTQTIMEGLVDGRK